MKDKIRLERLRDMYASKGYKTKNLSEREIGEIAYERSLQVNIDSYE